MNADPFNSIDSLRNIVLDVKRKTYYYLYLIFRRVVNRCIFFRPRWKKAISDCWVVLIICSGASVYTKPTAADKYMFFEEKHVLYLFLRITCKAEDHCSVCLAPSQSYSNHEKRSTSCSEIRKDVTSTSPATWHPYLENIIACCPDLTVFRNKWRTATDCCIYLHVWYQCCICRLVTDN